MGKRKAPAVDGAADGPEALKRRIYFYKAMLGALDDGSPRPFDASAAIDAVRQIRFPERYWSPIEGAPVAAFLDSESVRGRRLMFGFSRSNALPRTDRMGVIGDLEIEAGTNILEPVHVVFFDNNIVGAEFNFYGPRIGRLATYLSMKAPDQAPGHLSFEPLLARDALQKLRGLDGAHFVDIKMNAAGATHLPSTGLFGALKAAARSGEVDVVEVRVQIRRRKSIGPTRALLRDTIRVLRRRGLAQDYVRFVVKGVNTQTERTEEVDVLGEQFVARADIDTIDERHRAVKSTSAYRAILDAYEELRDELESAATLAG